MDVQERVINVIREMIPRGTEVKPDHHFVDDLAMDSLDCIELTMGVEDEFGIEISDRDMEQFSTPASIIAYLATRGIH